MKTDHRTGGRALAVFLLACAGYLLSMFYRISATMVGADLSRDLGLGPADLGNVSAAFFYVFAAAQFVVGPALDRFGPRRVMALLGAVAVAGAVLFARAETLGVALLARGLLGLGMAGNFMGALMLVARWFPPTRFATVTGLLAALGSCGMALAATPLAWLSEKLGWRGAFLAIAALNVAELAVLVLAVRDAPPGARPLSVAAPSPWKNFGRLARSWAFWGIGLGAFFRYGCLMALLGLWAGPYLAGGLGFDAVTAGNILAAAGFGYALGLPVAGRLSDAVLASRKYVVMPALWAMTALSVALMLLPAGIGPFLPGALFFLYGFAAAPGQVMYPHAKELMPRSMTATAMAGVNLFTMLGPAVVMNATGLLVGGEAVALGSPAAYRPVFWFFVAGLGASAAAYMLIPDSVVGGKSEDG